MTVFFIAASVLVFLALLGIIPSTLKGSSRAELDQLETNVGIAKERRKQLQSALASGAMDQTTYDTELIELENNLALDITAHDKQQGTTRGGMFAAALIALFIPVGSGALYLQLGNPDAVDTAAMHQTALAAKAELGDQPPALTELLPNLERKLAENPEDRDGWLLLGKSYLSISEFANAKRALMKAYDMDKEDPDLLSQLAEASAMVKGGDLSGEAGQFLDDALAINPEHDQSLWLKAIAVQQAGQHDDAIARFEKLRTRVTGNAGALTSIDEMIARSKTAMDSSSEPNNASNTTTTPNAIASASTDASKISSLSVTVSLDQNVIEKVNASDSVFIFARASNGPPMPLAVSRHTVADLPITVVLDDTMAMIPAMTLSQFPSVTVGARVSQSGNAIAQPGDWFTELENVLVEEKPELQLTIDRQK